MKKNFHKSAYLKTHLSLLMPQLDVAVKLQVTFNFFVCFRAGVMRHATLRTQAVCSL